MEPTSTFNIWILTFITDEDKAWLDSTDYLYRRETGARYMGQDCWVIFPKEKYVGFLLLKFGDRLKSLPLEMYKPVLDIYKS